MFNPTSCRTLSVLAVAALLVLPACKTAEVRAIRSGKVAITGLETVRGGPVAVHIENGLGETEVESDSRVKVPTVEAFALDAAGRRIPGAAKAWVAAELIESEGVAVLRVLALDQREPNRPPVYVRVRAPEIRGVSVRGAGGPVRLNGVSGPIDVQVAAADRGLWPQGASIDVVMSQPADAAINLSSVDGRVHLELPASSRGRLQIQAPQRVLELEAPGVRVTGARTKGDIYTATLNGGINPIVLSSPRREVVVRAR